MNTYSTLDITTSNKVIKISLNRPQVKNAFNSVLMKDLTNCFNELQCSDSRLVILTGKGSDFCSGADLNWMNDSDSTNSDKSSKLLLQMYLAIANCDLPILCHVFGRVYAGGVGLCAASDIVVAEERTTFCLSEARVGLAPALMAPALINRIGISRFKELALTTRKFDSHEALQMGLVDYQFQTENFESLLDSLIYEIMQSAPMAIKAIKRICRKLERSSLESNGDFLSDVLAQLRGGQEAGEGISAFKEKRKPNWSTHDKT